MTGSHQITCPVCGHRFVSSSQACETCPLHQGCTLVCCPACGHTTIDTSKSTLARFADRLIKRWDKAPTREN